MGTEITPSSWIFTWTCLESWGSWHLFPENLVGRYWKSLPLENGNHLPNKETCHLWLSVDCNLCLKVYGSLPFFLYCPHFDWTFRDVPGIIVYRLWHDLWPSNGRVMISCSDLVSLFPQNTYRRSAIHWDWRNSYIYTYSFYSIKYNSKTPSM